VKRKVEELPEEQLKPAPLIAGADLIAGGYEPGPRFAEILAAVEDAQLEGRVGSREEALAMVREMFRR
jgi:poly(A) polymerase